MPYQESAGTAGSDSGGSVDTTTMPAQAPPDLGTGAGGLMQIGTTQVTGQSGTPGATLPVDAIEQASSMIAQGKADLGQTAGAENRLNGFDGVGGGGGGANGANAQAAAGTATKGVDSNNLGGSTSLGAKPAPGPGGQPPPATPAPPATPPPPDILQA
jgi:hypothetical protein